VRQIYDRLFAERAGRADGNQFDLAGTDEEDKEATLPQILGPVKYAPELAHFQFRANALAIARRLLGPEAEARGEHAILKPAHIGAETPWHQDEAYWDPGLEYNSISIWFPLQEATVENGCMQFIPGSHRRGVQPHHSINNDPRIHGLVIDEVDPTKAVACPIPAGGVTIHHCRAAHYAGPNQTNAPRRAYILIFAIPPKKRGAARDFYWQREKQTAREERRKAAATKAAGQAVM
jgi:ectoine hydroxylase-related dioxygenase (phytanoyl-CoA dioxygenase family)